MLNKRDVHTLIIDVVALREDLNTELTVNDTVRGQLCEEHTVVLVNGNVGTVWCNIPTATSEVVNDNVVASSKFTGPRTWQRRRIQIRAHCRTLEVKRHI